MFDYILYGISGLLLLWMSFRWSSKTFLNVFFKLLYLFSGLANIVMIFFKLGYIVKL
jgi:hypothetical protein